MALLTILAVPAQAETLTMFSVGAVRSTLEPTAEQFQKNTGHTIAFTFGTAGITEGRVLKGEVCDVVAAPASRLEAMARAGKIDAASRRDLGSVKIGVGVRKGEPAPDISTLDAFKRSLLAAPRITYSHPSSGASSGIHFHKMVEQMGLVDALKPPKTVFKHGGTEVMLAVSNREADIGITQVSEILPNPGVYVVGPLPQEIQNATVYSIAACAGTPRAALVKAWIDLLLGEDARARIRKAGFETD
jgi:molybdate transport system substrate-binding protein